MDPQCEGPEVTGALVPVKVTLMGELRRWAGRREVEVSLAPGSTMRALAQGLGRACGEGFARRALTREGSLQPHIAAFVDGVQVSGPDGTDTVLLGGRVELMLLPAAEGG